MSGQKVGEEIIQDLKENGLDPADIVCIEIYTEPYDDENVPMDIKWRPENGTSLKTLFGYLNRFQYNAGYGSQELYGTIYLTESRWFERHEYDGCESWVLKQFEPSEKFTENVFSPPLEPLVKSSAKQ